VVQDIPVAPCRFSPRCLTEDEERHALQILNSERFRDTAPGEVYAVLLDEGDRICSERTMYRILARHGMTRQRRQSSPRHYEKPELLATKPNELWSWDITKLKGPTKWTYYYLYKIIDVYSRNVVGWMVAHRESAELAEGLIADTILKQEIRPGQLTIHADRGSSMTSVPVGQLLADLGVTKTHSRPHVSNDNPYSESGFKTLKYRPDFPEYFGSIEDARLFCQNFFTWYNTEHRHSGIAMLTPDNVHYNQSESILNARSITLMNAYMDHPERFVKGVPSVEQLPKEVWINKPCSKKPVESSVS
jgi:putative transposase